MLPQFLQIVRIKCSIIPFAVNFHVAHAVDSTRAIPNYEQNKPARLNYLRQTLETRPKLIRPQMYEACNAHRRIYRADTAVILQHIAHIKGNLRIPRPSDLN